MGSLHPHYPHLQVVPNIKDIKKYKASIIYHDLARKKKEGSAIDENLSKKNKEIEKIKKVNLGIQTSIKTTESKITSINSTIQKSTGFEQEKLNQEIANIRAELAGTNVRMENFTNKLSEIERQKQELTKIISENELTIKELQVESPTKSKTKKQVEGKKQALEELEEQRKKFYTIKSELKSVKERIQDKNNLLQNYNNESEFLLKQIKSFSRELFDRETSEEKLNTLKISLAEKKEFLDNLNKKEIELEKISGTNEYEVDKQNKLMEKISKMDVCPICKSKITTGHVESIHKDTLPRIENLKKEITDSDRKLNELYSQRDIIKEQIEQVVSEISKRESDLINLSNIDEKKNQIKSIQDKINLLKGELTELSKRRKNLEANFDSNANIEQKYETARVEVQEISLRTKENINSEISFKQREFDRSKISLKQLTREEEDLNQELKELEKEINEKNKALEKKNEQEQELAKKFQKLISERDALQKKIREDESTLSAKQNSIYNIEQQMNNLKIDQARVNAEIENLETEMLNFQNLEIIKAGKEVLLQRLNKAQEIISRIGSVNLRSLEVYDHVKKEYDLIKEKTEIIAKEKEGILKIIQEIDIKKKKTFIKTLTALNENFSRIFSQLSEKGQVYLDLEDRKDPFAAGVNITVKTGHGKYFDVKSLSGGEQTLIALSLIFAIQELNPYYFYVLDEIDAALDKRNSERLANLLQKYMQKGQYIVISHNDQVISNATNLYGVSMHEGISKIVSLKV